MVRPTIDSAKFDELSAYCNRWADKSLSIARALIVEGAQLAEVAKAHDCSAAYANVIRSRFYTKAEQVRLEQFKQSMKPAGLADLEPYGRDIETLQADGYTVPQLVSYLAQHDVSVSADTVRKYLKGAKS